MLAGQGEGAQDLDPEYAALMGKQVTEGASALPTPADVGAEIWGHPLTHSTTLGRMTKSESNWLTRLQECYRAISPLWSLYH